MGGPSINTLPYVPKMNVFRSETTTNDDIENIKNDIVTCDADTNDDIVISFKGFKHNKSGFILRVTNIERLTDATMEKWKGLVQPVASRSYKQYLRLNQPIRVNQRYGHNVKPRT